MEWKEQIHCEVCCRLTYGRVHAGQCGCETGAGVGAASCWVAGRRPGRDDRHGSPAAEGLRDELVCGSRGKGRGE